MRDLNIQQRILQPQNNQLEINKYKIIPFIFLNDHFKRNKLNDQLSHTLQSFMKTNNIKTEKKDFLRI